MTQLESDYLHIRRPQSASLLEFISICVPILLPVILCTGKKYVSSLEMNIWRGFICLSRRDSVEVFPYKAESYMTQTVMWSFIDPSRNCSCTRLSRWRCLHGWIGNRSLGFQLKKTPPNPTLLLRFPQSVWRSNPITHQLRFLLLKCHFSYNYKTMHLIIRVYSIHKKFYYPAHNKPGDWSLHWFGLSHTAQDCWL